VRTLTPQNTFEKQLCKEICVLLQRTLSDLVLDPSFFFRIKGCQLIDVSAERFGTSYKIIKLQISTNNRSLLLGQMKPFLPKGRTGYFDKYLSGLVDGYLAGKYSEKLADKYSLFIDVERIKPYNESTCMAIPVAWAEKKGIIDKGSELFRQLRKYEISEIIICGSSIIGPSLDMMMAVSEVVRQKGPKKILDLFSGTGTLSKIALVEGAQHATCLDISTEVFEKNLGKFLTKIKIEKKDAFKVRNFGKYDLAILDTFYDDALQASKAIIPKLLDTRAILFHVGLFWESNWMYAILEQLRKNLQITKTFKFGNSFIILGEPK
jgi:16S rRNA G966 N2-methylase RsmD